MAPSARVSFLAACVFLYLPSFGRCMPAMHAARSSEHLLEPALRAGTLPTALALGSKGGMSRDSWRRARPDGTGPSLRGATNFADRGAVAVRAELLLRVHRAEARTEDPAHEGRVFSDAQVLRLRYCPEHRGAHLDRVRGMGW